MSQDKTWVPQKIGIKHREWVEIVFCRSDIVDWWGYIPTQHWSISEQSNSMGINPTMKHGRSELRFIFVVMDCPLYTLYVTLHQINMMNLFIRMFCLYVGIWSQPHESK